jgi:hypothetical protein
MRDTFKVEAGRWFVVGGLLLLMSIASVGYVRAASLSDAEITSLTYIREEEKLARDVYIFLYEKYGSPIFKNISVSEQTHMDAIKILLDRYGIQDPVGLNTDPLGQDVEGVFYDEDLRTLYNELINQGSRSLVDALKVGVFIEETDIDDLNEGIDSTAHNDVQTVYSNLLQGSQNHLDAFCSNLVRRGVKPCVAYEPEP